ncbi:NADP-dependent phosphogluconate dehydrogenase [uncultured Anaerotruncus sp.]|uniref:NADP-dependent phosphogluconate dehydrogenase n=1 Tax=uncultured Anaerotruncus sp. TaxID=905011 RepID=UPI00280A54E9|nr:NADP-dependent phosphogluconate dehydrogenase [uncultured Anaerotruncus sp.]
MQALFDIGMVGLSVMGRSLALNMADHGFRVAGYNRSREVTEQVMREHPHENLSPFYSLQELVAALRRPRRVMLMIQAGPPVDAVIGQLEPLLEEGDIILDGGNSFFEDTRRRQAALEKKGLVYFGVGVSGGEEGARHGPSIMPGGGEGAYPFIRPMLEAVAARAGGEPCCAYIGPDGAGHYVKMVHNGIEYADMQLIAESYLLLKHVGGFSNRELADVFARWNEGELRSFLVGITAGVFRERDDLAEGELIDRIVDSAAQKGTGRWASIEALRQGVDLSMITAACNARILSNRLEERAAAARLLPGPAPARAEDRDAFAEQVREGLYAAKIAAYAQGFALLRDASGRYGWDLRLGEIASIFRAGCIIQAAFLDDITAAYRRNPGLENLMLDEFFRARVAQNQRSLRAAAGAGIASGLPLPVMTAAVSYLDAFRGAHVGANLIQAQRDWFGAHTFLRTDREGSFHHEWGKGL